MEKCFFYRNALVFSKSTHLRLIHYIINLFKVNEIDVQTVQDNEIYIVSVKNPTKFFKEAQFNKIRKFSTKKREVDPDLKIPDEVIYYESKKAFIFRNKEFYLPELRKGNEYNINLTNSKEKTDIDNESLGLGLFSENEMITLELKILHNLNYNPEELTQLLSELGKLNEETKHVLEENHSIFDIFESLDFLEVVPLHYSDYKEQISKISIFSKKFPYQHIRNYYGDKVAIYFAWMTNYQDWLFYPALFGLVIFFLQKILVYDVSFLYTIYTLFVTIWSQVFIRAWERKCAELEIEWDNFTEEYSKENVRKEFKGVIRKSPITEQNEKYYPDSKRLIQYLISGIKALPYLVFAFFVMTVFLNISGVIKVEDNSILEIKFLASLSQPGAILDAQSWRGTLISILQPITILFLNKAYRNVAVETTNAENHRNKSNYENSLIIKRFIFEFFDGFICLIYLGLIKGDRVALKSNLVSFFISNQIRRVLTESVIPSLVNYFSKKSTIDTFKFVGDPTYLQLGSKIDPKSVQNQINSTEYEPFDDYLEIVIEYGYLILFAECFPYAPILILLFSNLETRSDIFKLGSVFKKPPVLRKRNIGIWNLLMRFLSFSSLFTNTLLYIFNENLHKEGAFSSGLILFFLIQHDALAIFFIINFVYKLRPHWVNIFHLRLDHKLKGNRWSALLEDLKSEASTKNK